MTDQYADLFGTAFRDYLAGETEHYIVVHTDLAEDELLPVRYFFRGFDELPRLEKRALKLCRGKILDVGSGAGCHAKILQDRGMDVTSMDISPGAVEIQAQRGIKKTRLGDFFDLDEDEKFDTLLVLMDSIGLVQTLDRLHLFFEKADALLASGGQILVNSSDLIALYMEEDGSILLELGDRYYGEVEYKLEYKGRPGAPFKWIFIDFENLSHYASGAGFSAEVIYEEEGDPDYLARITRK